MFAHNVRPPGDRQRRRRADSLAAGHAPRSHPASQATRSQWSRDACCSLRWNHPASCALCHGAASPSVARRLAQPCKRIRAALEQPAPAGTPLPGGVCAPHGAWRMAVARGSWPRPAASPVPRPSAACARQWVPCSQQRALASAAEWCRACLGRASAAAAPPPT